MPAMHINDFAIVKYFYSDVESVLKMHQTYGKIFKGKMFFYLFVVISDPKDTDALLTNRNCLTKSAEYNQLKPIFRTGLITSGGSVWHKHRKILNKCFTYGALLQYGETMKCVAKEMVADLNNLLEIDKDINVLPPVRRWMAYNLYRTLIGVDIENDDQFFNAVKRISNINVDTYRMMAILPTFLFKFTKVGKEMTDSMGILKSVVDKIIVDKKKQLTNNSGDHNGDASKLSSLTDLLISSNELTDEEIRDEIQTFVISGLETTSITVSYCLYALSRHPDIQEKLYKEILLYSSGDDIPSHEELHKMKYLTCVLKETMRYYTAVSLLGRYITQDLTLPSGNMLPAGCHAYLDIYTIHHDPDVYKQPYEFMPERFDDENDVPMTSFLPFGAGPRMCIGYKFAMMEMKLMLAILVKRFLFIPAVSELEIKRRFLLVPAKGIPVKLKAR